MKNTSYFFHGGNLTELGSIKGSSGRMEYGAGLYMTTSRNVVEKYIKGSRKLYVIELDNSITPIDAVSLPPETILSSFKSILKGSSYKKFHNIINRYDSEISLDMINNILVNNNLLKKSNIDLITQFFIENNVDCVIDNNTFGFGETQIVLFNLSKIVNYFQIKQNDPEYFKDF